MYTLIKSAVRSPLAHFFIIGAARYGGYGMLAAKAETTWSNTITITVAQTDWLETAWQKRWNRPPTAAERQGLIEDYIRETVLYREALAMGLDKDDVIIRRRLAQKLEFLYQDVAALRQPIEGELEEYFAANRSRYQQPEVMTFTHVFVDPDQRGEHTLKDADEILATLNTLDSPLQNIDDLGDSFMLQRYYPERSEAEIAKLFGSEFAKSLNELTDEQWHGPILSGYGVHLVYIHGRSQAPALDFAAARDRVLQEWQSEKRQAFNKDYYANLLARYDVRIEDELNNMEVASR